MAKAINSREYRDGDAPLINQLYHRVTGRKRSEHQYQWQWRQAPAGPGFVYLIEYQEPCKREPVLIGHHGIMPLRFCNDNNNLIAGKTENTMVDPSYRQKIIYPRFESRFKNEYSGRCNVLFSTTGPESAIRQRLAQGYQEIGEWKHLWLSARRALFGSSRQYSGFQLDPECFDFLRLDLNALTSVPLQPFWETARQKYPFTASRLVKDFKWRFIDNPYHEYLLGVLWGDKQNGKVAGYVVVRRPSKSGSLPMVEDIVAGIPCADDFAVLLQLTLKALLLRGFCWASLPFVVDRSQASTELLTGATRFVSRSLDVMSSVKREIFDRSGPRARGMMRWVNPNDTDQISIDNWYITGIVLEGR